MPVPYALQSQMSPEHSSPGFATGKYLKRKFIAGIGSLQLMVLLCRETQWCEVSVKQKKEQK